MKDWNNFTGRKHKKKKVIILVVVKKSHRLQIKNHRYLVKDLPLWSSGVLEVNRRHLSVTLTI